MRVGLVLSPGFQTMSLAARSVFEFANICGAQPAYELAILSENGGVVPGSGGVEIGSRSVSADAFDTVLVGGGIDFPTPTTGLSAWLRKTAPGVRRMGGICTGAAVLAHAGLLDGRRVTTHWLIARELQARFPAIRVEEDRIFVADGPFWTSAGMSAGIDLALAMVEADHGAQLARSVARKLVLYHRRGGGQSQHSELLMLEPKSDRIETALTYARGNLDKDLSVERLAAAAALSPRQFSRAFHAETGQSPAKAVERLRVEAARILLQDTRHPVALIAQQTGFADPERMRRAFTRNLGQPPQSFRRSTRTFA